MRHNCRDRFEARVLSLHMRENADTYADMVVTMHGANSEKIEELLRNQEKFSGPYRT